MHHYGLTYEQTKTGLGSIAIKNYRHAKLNPKAYFNNYSEVDMNAYMNAPMISWPSRCTCQLTARRRPSICPVCLDSLPCAIRSPSAC